MRIWRSFAPGARVRLSLEKLAEAAEATAVKETKMPDWKIAGVYPDDHRAFVIHNFWLNTVNFAFARVQFGKGFKRVRCALPGGPLFSGAFACAAAFLRGFESMRFWNDDIRVASLRRRRYSR